MIGFFFGRRDIKYEVVESKNAVSVIEGLNLSEEQFSTFIFLGEIDYGLSFTQDIQRLDFLKYLLRNAACCLCIHYMLWLVQYCIK